MAIYLTDSIRAATVKGKIADAVQVFLSGDEENVQEALNKKATSEKVDELSTSLNELKDKVESLQDGGETNIVVDVEQLQEGSILSDSGSSCIYRYNDYPAYSFPSNYGGVTSTFVFARITNEQEDIKKVYVITGRSVVKVYEDDIPDWIYNTMPDTIAQKIQNLENLLTWK